MPGDNYDWINDAVKEMGAEDICTNIGRAFNILAKHNPFKYRIAYMPVPRCETCKHWDTDMITDMRTAECQLKIMQVQVATAGSIIHVQMRTRHDFGCVQWEKK